MSLETWISKELRRSGVTREQAIDCFVQTAGLRLESAVSIVDRLIKQNQTPNYPYTIYQGFVSSDDSTSSLGQVWHEYQAAHGQIDSGELVDRLVYGAIAYTCEQLLILLDDEEHDRGIQKNG